MRGAALKAVDAGLRVVSPMVDLEEAAFGACVTHAGFTGDGARVVAAFGDGAIRWRPARADVQGWEPAGTLGATPLAAAPDIDGRGILVGTDDGRLVRLAPGQDREEIACLAGAWIENVAAHPAAGLRAFSAGREVYVRDASAFPVAVFGDHPSTPTGIAFSPLGDRLAVSRYDGVTVWGLAASASPESLSWHGSHTALAWSPDGRFIVTAMQENEMHCWRLADAKSMRMSGYTRKIRSLAWTSDSKYVAAAGAETVTCWRCDGDGPAGRPPLEFGYAHEGVVTRVAAGPVGHVVAGGYDDGTVMIGDVEKGDAIIARPGDGAAVTALAWSPDGRTLVAGGAQGAVAVIRMVEALA